MRTGDNSTLRTLREEFIVSRSVSVQVERDAWLSDPSSGVGDILSVAREGVGDIHNEICSEMLFVDHRHLCQESLLGASHESIDCVWVFDGSLRHRERERER